MPLGVGMNSLVDYEMDVLMFGGRMEEGVKIYGYIAFGQFFDVGTQRNYEMWVMRYGQMVKVNVQFDFKKFKK